MTAAGTALIERLLPAVRAGITASDDLTLAHEAERYESQESSPLVVEMRAVVAAEQTRRRAGAR